MQWDTSKLRASSTEDSEKAWMDTINFIPATSLSLPKRKGTPHPVIQLAEKARQFFLSKGFNEILLPALLEEKEAALQAGIEAPLVLDRSYYVALLPKPTPKEIDLSKLRAIAPSFNEAKSKTLSKLLKSFSNNEFTTKQLLDKMVSKLGIRMEQAVPLINAIAPDFHQRTPLVSTCILRDSTLTAWFESLSAVVRREPLPAFLFTVGMDYSPEVSSLTTSFVIIGENASIDAGEPTLSSFLATLGVDHSLRKKKATSHQFIPGTETQIISKNSETLGSFGMLSPIALSNYDISVPVFCTLLSLSSIAVALNKAETGRAALYPQFYGNWSLPDTTIAALIKVGESPITSWGKDISRKLVRTAELYSRHPAPCEFKVFSKELEDSRVEVWLISESNTLCNESILDEIFVYDGVIVSMPPMGGNSNPIVRAARQSGIKTGIKPLNAFADMVASRVEKNPTQSQRFNPPPGLNISVPRIVTDYMDSKNKSFSLKNTLGIRAEVRVKRLWVHEQPR